MKVTNKISNVLWYLVILPFLFPFGFAEYFSAYKNFRILILGVATIIILLGTVYLIIANQGKMKISVPLLVVILYHIVLLIITLSVQGTISQGLQKIFISPAICIFLDMACRNKMRYTINTICNLLIIVLALNLFIFNQWFFPNYFLLSKHVMFIGHVQVAAEIGLLGVLIGYIEYCYGVYRNKSIVLIILSLLTMLYSQTSASFLSIVLLSLFLILRKSHSAQKIVNNHMYLLTFFLLVVYIIVINISRIPLFAKHYATLTTLLSGRTYIWDTGLKLFYAKPILGYGAYGVLIKVFWSAWLVNKSGFNYAHNTLLQLLLDGGIVLAIIFIVSIALYIRSEDKKLNNDKIKYVSHILLLTLLSVGLVESLTEYYYVFIFLSILPFLYEIDKDKKHSVNYKGEER